MNKETFTFRMNLETYRRIRKYFKCKYGETSAEYFKRLSEWLEQERNL
jgi:predicted DNA-binding protein